MADVSEMVADRTAPLPSSATSSLASGAPSPWFMAPFPPRSRSRSRFVGAVPLHYSRCARKTSFCTL
jgi:hypothetical protein